jgi:hypothetical protein
LQARPHPQPLSKRRGEFAADHASPPELRFACTGLSILKSCTDFPHCPVLKNAYKFKKKKMNKKILYNLSTFLGRDIHFPFSTFHFPLSILFKISPLRDGRKGHEFGNSRERNETIAVGKLPRTIWELPA